MFVITVTFVVEDTRASTFREAVLLQAENSLQKEDGCHCFDVAQDGDDPTRFFLYELYTDRAAFDLHLATAHFKEFDTTVTPWLKSKEVHSWNLIGRGE